MTPEEKACIECDELWPNDAEFFHSGPDNVDLLSVCHAARFQERYNTPKRRSKKLLAMPVENSAAAALQGIFYSLVNASQQQERKQA